MVSQVFNFKLRYVISIFLVCVVLLLSFIPSVFADPDTSEDVPVTVEDVLAPEEDVSGNVSNLGWIDLSATVPENFTGSVLVQIRNIADDSYYDIECFVLNNFRNGQQVPLGNYVIEVATTAEPFFYIVTCETEEFELTDSYSLHVVVEEIPDDDRILVENIENIEVSSEPTNDVKDNNDEFTDGIKDKNSDGVKDENSIPILDDDSTEVEKETKGSWSSILISFMISLVMVLIAGFVLWRIKNR